MARTSSQRTSVYPSRIDAWIAALMLGGVVAMIPGVVATFLDAGALRAAQAVFLLAAVVGLMVWVGVGTRYTLDGGDLIIRSGPFSWRIAIDTITAVGPASGVHRWRSSPAMSMQRLAIVHGGGKTVLISPSESERFLADLKARQKAAARQ